VCVCTRVLHRHATRHCRQREAGEGLERLADDSAGEVQGVGRRHGGLGSGHVAGRQQQTAARARQPRGQPRRQA